MKILLLIVVLLYPNFIVIGNSSINVSSIYTNTNTVKSFSSNMLLSSSDLFYSFHVEPTLAIGPNNEIYAGWKEAIGPTSKGVDVSFTKSTDNGQNWSNPISLPSNVSTDSYKSDPWLQVFDNNIYYSYLDYASDSNATRYSQITVARSSDDGVTWATAKASSNVQFADKESFIVSSNGIFLVYDDVSLQTGLGEVKLSKSVDGGKNFNELGQINDNKNADIAGPYPALSSNQTLFVAWLNVTDSASHFGDVIYDSSINQGKTFNSDRDLNPESNNGYYKDYKATLPVLKFDSKDRLYVLWAEFSTNWQVFLRYSDDFGFTWSVKIPIYDNNNADQWLPDMAIDSKNIVHVVWFEEENSQYRPYYRELSFSGENRAIVEKSSILPIADQFTSSSFIRPGDYCTIRVDSYDNPHVVWTDGRSGKLDIYYAQGSVNPSSITSNTSAKSSPSFTFYSFSFVLVTFFLIKKRYKKRR